MQSTQALGSSSRSRLSIGAAQRRHPAVACSSFRRTRSAPPKEMELSSVTAEIPAGIKARLNQEASKKGISLEKHVADIILTHCRPQRMDSVDTLYVTEPIITIVDGLLEGEATVSQALEHGDFGLGTLNMLDGEVVVHDGIAYHQHENGSVTLLQGPEKTPYMTVTYFRRTAARAIPIPGPMTLGQLEDLIESSLGSKNIFYAIEVTGNLSYVKARCVRKQAQARRLVEVAHDQAMFEYKNEEGVLVGFWAPSYMGSSVNVPGFHLHYLSSDKQRGGHLLNCTVDKGIVLLQEIHRTKVDLPFNEAFLSTDLKQPSDDEIKQAEKER